MTSCLLAQVFKCCYFHNIFFLRQGWGLQLLAHGEVFVRSLQAKALEEAGLRCKINVDSQVDPWSNPWLSRIDGFRPFSHQVESIKRVGDLMIHNTNCWDANLINQLFSFDN